MRVNVQHASVTRSAYARHHWRSQQSPPRLGRRLQSFLRTYNLGNGLGSPSSLGTACAPIIVTLYAARTANAPPDPSDPSPPPANSFSGQSWLQFRGTSRMRVRQI